MNYSTWTTPRDRRGWRGPLCLASVAVLAGALTGCHPANNPSTDDGGLNGDGGTQCTTEYAPVCGVDGLTYSNACLANAVGVLVSHYGPCDDQVVRCGGVYGDTCAANEYCDYAFDGGVADIIAPYPSDLGVNPPPQPSGVCRPRDVTYCDDDTNCPSDQYCQRPDGFAPPGAPDAAPPFIPQPLDAGVPATDLGTSWDGGPAPSDNGVILPPRGTCQPREVRYCYGEGDPICLEGEFCDLSGARPAFAPPPPGDPARPIAPPLGVCAPVVDPPGCPNVDDFVCGTNGITYQNVCVADSMGATVAYPGRCLPVGPLSCGGRSGHVCADGDYCYFEPATSCDFLDGTGVCLPRPEACTLELAPVCGCDGQTYGNACEAAARGTSVASYGACGADPGPGGEGTTCGGRLGATCNPGLFCNYPAAAECGATDALGACLRIPEVCNDIWAPVCGCDGTVYSSDCVAASAQVSVGPSSFCTAP